MNIINMSIYLAQALEGVEDQENEPIPFSKIDSKNLNRVIEYCTHHKFGKKETELQAPLPPAESKDLGFIKD